MFEVSTTACERSVSGAGNGVERAKNRLERSRVQKIQVRVSGVGSRRNGNGAMSGQNLPLKIRSTVKPCTQSKKLKINLKSYYETVIENYYYFVSCVENKSYYLAKEHHFNYAVFRLGMLGVGTRNRYAQTGPCKSTVNH